MFVGTLYVGEKSGDYIFDDKYMELLNRPSVRFILGYVFGSFLTWAVIVGFADKCAKKYGNEWYWNGNVCVNETEGAIRIY